MTRAARCPRPPATCWIPSPCWTAPKPEELGDYVRAQYPDGLQPMGADALRFTLLTGSTPGNDMNLSLQRVEGNRNFTNKIWNAVRFVLSQLRSWKSGNWE